MKANKKTIMQTPLVDVRAVLHFTFLCGSSQTDKQSYKYE
jgi:hypothetical protein